MPDPIWIQTFVTKDLPGSPQGLYFFENFEDFETAKRNFINQTDFDISLVHQVSNQTFEVHWLNRSGAIRFCGSAAYALVWWLHSNYSEPYFYIKSADLTLTSLLKDDRILLKIPREKMQNENKGTYFNKENSILLIEVNSLEDLKSFEARPNQLLQKYSVSALGAFYWASSQGYLRYFVPWHGRNEDYVTGSIHTYLAPMVLERWGQRKQLWTQVSPRGGQVRSEITDQGVFLTGDCRLSACPTLSE